MLDPPFLILKRQDAAAVDVLCVNMRRFQAKDGILRPWSFNDSTKLVQNQYKTLKFDIDL